MEKDYKTGLEQRNDYKKIRNRHLRRSIFSIEILIIGVIANILLLLIIQTRASERTQLNSSTKILSEVETTLKTNEDTISSAMEQFNSVNQTSLLTLNDYVKDIDLLGSLGEIRDKTPEEQQAAIVEKCEELQVICDDINVENIFLLNKSGLTIVSNHVGAIGMNWSTSVSREEFQRVTTYSETQNGTLEKTSEGDVITPILVPHGTNKFYAYSTYFETDPIDNVDYFLMISTNDGIINAELYGIKDISSILKGVTVGKNGFLFAFDTNAKNFIYFDDGVEDLSGKPYEEYGMNEKAEANDYAGYQKINGVSYYCVTREYHSDTYGNFTVIAAVVSGSEMVGSNLLTVVFSSLAFVLVSCLIVGYGMVLKRDYADYLMYLDDKITTEYRDENTNFERFTEEEIQERTKIQIECMKEKGEDKKLKRRLIGTRDARGVQNYFSHYIFGKMFPLTIVGLGVIFLISFFSQTLLGFNNVTNVSLTRLHDVEIVLKNNEDNAANIQEHVDEQYLSKAVLFSYVLEEEPNLIFDFDVESRDTHRLYDVDEDGNKIYLVDQYYNPRYSISNSSYLKSLCENTQIDYVSIYDEDGYVVATSNDNWYTSLAKENVDESYLLRGIIDEKYENAILSPVTKDDLTTKEMGSAFYYFTYEDAQGHTVYTSKTNYNKYLAGDTSLGEITKHRSLVKICVDQTALDDLYKVTSLSYVLANMHVYGEDSFFIAFDNTSEHRLVYSPVPSSIGKTAAEVGASESIFKLTGTYNGFQKVNGVEYYQSIALLGDYYIATAIPTRSIYETRNAVASYTLLISFLFILFASGFYTVSSDRADSDYIQLIKHRDAKDNEMNKETFMLSTPGGKKRTTSAMSRYYKTKWRYKTAEQKLGTLLVGYSTLAAILVLIAIINAAINRNNSDNIFTYIFSGEWERGFNIFAITQALMIIILIITVTKLVQVIVRSFCGALGSRVETTGNLVVSVLRYGGIIGGLFYCLYLFGFNTTSLLTSAGILSIVIGLGAQSLISDIIAGVFIVFEGEFRVGDIVTIGDFRGQVVEIGLRTTKIVDASQNVKIFNNSSISGVVNMTKEASFAMIDVGIEYGESLERVELILKEAFPKIKKKLPSIIEGPFYKGVVELGNNSVNIRIMALCEEQDRIQLGRDLNREIFLLFNKNHINIPFPQVTLSYFKENENSASKKDKQEAEDFVDDQKNNALAKLFLDSDETDSH